MDIQAKIMLKAWLWTTYQMNW